MLLLCGRPLRPPLTGSTVAVTVYTVGAADMANITFLERRAADDSTENDQREEDTEQRTHGELPLAMCRASQ